MLKAPPSPLQTDGGRRSAGGDCASLVAARPEGDGGAEEWRLCRCDWPDCTSRPISTIPTPPPSKAQTRRAGAPKAGTLSNMLTQALQSNDQALLDEVRSVEPPDVCPLLTSSSPPQCLNTGNTKIVRATVARLAPAQILPFFQQVVSRFEVCSCFRRLDSRLPPPPPPVQARKRRDAAGVDACCFIHPHALLDVDAQPGLHHPRSLRVGEGSTSAAALSCSHVSLSPTPSAHQARGGTADRLPAVVEAQRAPGAHAQPRLGLAGH